MAASSIFRTETTQSGKSVQVTVSAESTIRIPLKGTMTHSARASVRLSDSGSVSFESHSEQLAPQGRTTTWEAKESRLLLLESNSESHISALTREVAVEPDSGPSVLSAVMLQLGLRSSWVGEGHTYGAYFVAGRSIHGLKLSPMPIKRRLSPEEAMSLHAFIGEIEPVEQSVSEAKWFGLPWGSGSRFELEWDSQRECIASIRFPVPVIGSLEVVRKDAAEPN